MIDSFADAGEAVTESDTLHAQDEALRAQRDALIELSACIAATGSGAEGIDGRFTELAAETLHIARASVWLYNSDHTEIRCIDLFERARGTHSSGIVLSYDNAPRYFEALRVMDVIAAHDARADARTSEFRDTYLDPLGITSMLDAPIREGAQVIGVLCHEHIGPARRFRADEEAFAIGLANLVSLRLAEARRARAEAEAHVRITALDAAANAIVITDVDGVIVWVNPAFLAMTGFAPDEVIGQTPAVVRSGLHDDAFYAHLWRTILSGHVWRGQLRNRRRNGDIHTEEMTITPVRADHGAITHFIAVKVDLTERQQMEERLMQSQKLETVGRLAAGIAHDFNNLLAVINGTADLATSGMSENDPLLPELAQIREAGERAALLTGQLLSFSRKQITNPEVLDLCAVAFELSELSKRLVGEHITMTFSAGEDPAWVRADRGQIGQVIMNLVVNAREAMKEGGTLTIEVRNCTADAQPAPTGASLHEAPFVMLAVRDTGTGMSEAVRAHLFEPFFTTRGTAGSGLGLSTVYGIVHQSSGTIDIDSELGVGTNVRILLPRMQHRSRSGASPDSREQIAGSGRILVVEDEKPLRSLAVRILKRAGYEVSEAANGRDALGVLEREPDTIDLVFTDVIMPELGGRDLADHIAARWPNIKVLFTSGYADDDGLRVDILEGGRSFLPKPFTVAGLTRQVRELLDG